jgi:hypothetical protein
MARKGSQLPITVVTLYRDAPYADLRFDVDLAGAPNIYSIALPLAGSKEAFLDGAGFVTRAPQDIMPGGAPPQFTPVHFVHRRRESSWGVTLANRDAAFLKDGEFYLVANENRRAATRDGGPQELFRSEPRSSPVQSFRFRIATQEEDSAKWKRLGADCNLPLRSVVVEENPSQPERGFFEISDPRVQLLAFKPAEFQPERHVLRFQNNGSEVVQGIRLTTLFRVSDAVRANTVEDATAEKVNLANFSLRPWQTLTVLVRLR